MSRSRRRDKEDDEKKPVEEKKYKRRPPSLDPEGRENEMISLAVDLAEKQLREGTASSAIIAHYLKLGSTKEKKEKDKLQKEIELLDAKADSLKSAKRSEESFAKALEAFKSYGGQTNEKFDD